ncbi:MAG TPA: AraC family transcriptional regulator [Thermoanaerobaculia bacterium]|jgi:AraC family transcriptional regulator
MLIPQERTIIAGPFRLRDVHYSAGELHRRHAHEELQISILLRGAMSEEVNGVAYAGCAGDVVVKPAGTMHADEFEPARIICIDADPRLFERELLPRYGWSRGGVVLLAAMRVVRSFMSGEAAADDVADLLAALPSRPVDDRLLATRAARALEDAFAETVSIEALARDLGVHRVHLARAFREQWGCSPREYVQRLRVRAAAHRLSSTREPLAGVALACGFSDQSHMSRIFRRGTGVTPAAFRRLAHA